MPCTPSASTVACAVSSAPGSNVGSSSPWRPRPLSPVRMPRTAPSVTSSRCASVSGSTMTPSSSARSAMKRASRASENTWLPLLCMGGGTIGRRAARERVSR